ncbi:MAG: methyltransferase [Deltaproteobacteria bacterium]|nr:methyltransferase [Deltaproteobacteria bacterium]
MILPSLELTTHPGLEQLAADEVLALAPKGVLRAEVRPDGLRGWVSVWGDWPAIEQAARRLRAVHHLFRPLDRFVLDAAEPLAQVEARLAALAIPALEPEGVSFGVRCERTGSHPFTSEDVGRVAGAGVRSRTLRAVNLRHPDVALRVDVREQICRVSLALTAEPLSHRHQRPYLPGVSMKASLAWAMLHLARPQGAPGAVLDPLCGGGTILLEAGALWPAARLLGSDLDGERVAGTSANLVANGLLPRATLRQGDALDLTALWGDQAPVDTVVTNPPFGKQVGKGLDLRRFYRELLQSLLPVLAEGGRIALLAERRAAFTHALEQVPALRLRHVRVVEAGGLHPAIFLLERA